MQIFEFEFLAIFRPGPSLEGKLVRNLTYVQVKSRNGEHQMWLDFYVNNICCVL